MNHTIAMSQTQQSGVDLWHLNPGVALRLPLRGDERVLSVVEGRLWVTVEGSQDRPPEDIWLEPGQDLQLHGVGSFVAEASPSASFRLSVPPANAASRSFSRWFSGLSSHAA
jgi:Protein of unknown function (DUF2917)